jgi:hypothetical protein
MGLATGIRSLNELAGAGEGIRLRAALHVGDVFTEPGGGVAGSELVTLARLLDAQPLRQILGQIPESLPVAAILSRNFYEATVPQGYSGIRPEEFWKVRVQAKEYDDDAWLHVPGAPVVVTAPDPAPNERLRPPERAGAHHYQHNDISGQSTGFIAQDGDVIRGAPARAGTGTDRGMTKELAALAGEAAVTLVTAMAGDAWQGVRAAIVDIWQRHRPKKANGVEARLDEDAGEVSEAADPDQVRTDAQGVWKAEFAALLSQTPAAAPMLRSLVARFGPDEAQPGSPSLTQVNIVRGSSTLMAAQRGHVIHHALEPAGPPPVPRQAPPTEPPGEHPVP